MGQTRCEQTVYPVHVIKCMYVNIYKCIIILMLTPLTLKIASIERLFRLVIVS